MIVARPCAVNRCAHLVDVAIPALSPAAHTSRGLSEMERTFPGLVAQAVHDQLFVRVGQDIAGRTELLGLRRALAIPGRRARWQRGQLSL
jgi:hypothetical protein